MVMLAKQSRSRPSGGIEASWAGGEMARPFCWPLDEYPFTRGVARVA